MYFCGVIEASSIRSVIEPPSTKPNKLINNLIILYIS